MWNDIDKDPAVSCVIVTGAGEAFSVGGDLGMVEEINGDFDTRARAWKEARDLVYNVINCFKPIVSAMTGPAVGAGLVVGLLPISRSPERKLGSSMGIPALASRPEIIRQ